MPIYEYHCSSCAVRFERLRPLSAPPLETCPSCGEPAQRLLSAGAGIIGGSRSRPHSGAHRSPGSCGHEQPCCGRELRCDRPPCGER